MLPSKWKVNFIISLVYLEGSILIIIIKIREAVALRMRYTKYSDNLMTNLLYLVVLLLIVTAPCILLNKKRFENGLQILKIMV